MFWTSLFFDSSKTCDKAATSPEEVSAPRGSNPSNAAACGAIKYPPFLGLLIIARRSLRKACVVRGLGLRVGSGGGPRSLQFQKFWGPLFRPSFSPKVGIRAPREPGAHAQNPSY